MPKKNYNWWILVLPRNATSFESGAIITNRLLPGDIPDEKKSVFGDFPIAGLDYTPFVHVRNDNTRITVSVPFVNINNSYGNSFDLYAAEKTRSWTDPLKLERKIFVFALDRREILQ